MGSASSASCNNTRGRARSTSGRRHRRRGCNADHPGSEPEMARTYKRPFLKGSGLGFGRVPFLAVKSSAHWKQYGNAFEGASAFSREGRKKRCSPLTSVRPRLCGRKARCLRRSRLSQRVHSRNGSPEIRGRGYVVASLEASLWAFIAVTRFRLARSKAVNLGDDADTTGAVYGQLAGAYYGVSGLPDE